MLIIRTVVLAALFVLGTFITGYAQMNPNLASPSIIINLPSRTLEVYSGNTLVKVYSVAIGKPSTPTPMGQFRIFDKEIDPVWCQPGTGEVVPSGPDNPLGYRWMEFAPRVGIHGTNAPWSIGSAVSHGCIRMHEEDVEELFPVIPCGTQVMVTYNRVEVHIDGNGMASIGIYPDIYGLKELTLAGVQKCLADNGLSGILADDELVRMIAEQADRQIVFARVGSITINGHLLTEHVLILDNTVYLPVWPVARALQVNLAWNEQNQLLQGEKNVVPGMVKGGMVYVTAADAQRLFGGLAVWRDEDNSLEMNVMTMTINGKNIPCDIQMVDGIPAISLQEVADALGQQVSKGADNSFSLQGKAVPTVFIAGQPYIQITNIHEVFQAYVYWNQQNRNIQLTYPDQVQGGTD